MSLRKRIERALAVLLVTVAALIALPINASATHYPDGAKCYDCHAVSGSKMVSGTNMIKMSPFIAQLTGAGWVAGQPLPCVFCHRKDAVSVPSVTEMKPVDAHFGSSVVSKHQANFATKFADATTLATPFNCNHCHSGVGEAISTGVVYNAGTGDANVHNKDAKTQTVNVYSSLVNNGGTPTSTTKAPHCNTTTCHGGASDQNYTGSGVTAKKVHTFGTDVTKPTLGTAFGDCSQCHASHRGEKQTSLMVLLNDGTVDAQDGTATYTPAQYVTPGECEACHVNGKGTAYTAKGHGQSAIAGGTVTCTACHNDTVPHQFATGGAPATNPLRFKFAENETYQSTIQQTAALNSAFSICLTCHAQFANKIHKGPSGTFIAGCNDCHEPHGTGVNTNVKMIRTQIPKVNASGTWVYGDASSTGTWDTNTYTQASDTGLNTTSMCDNRECHENRTVNGDLIFPLFSGATPLMSASRHSGSDQVAGVDCLGCHNHTDSTGSFSAIDSCTTCHGMPPVGNSTTAPGYTTITEAEGPHKLHAATDANGGYGIACQTCHVNYAGSTHNNGTYNSTTQTFGNATNASYQSVFFNLVAPALTRYASTTVSGTSPKTYNASYDIATRACSDLYCHSDGQALTSVNVKTAGGTGVADAYATNNTIQWNAAGYSTTNLACDSCHGGIDSGATQIATNSHYDHLLNGILCSNCHAGVVTTTATNTTTTIASRTLHVNGSKDMQAGGTYNGAAVSFTWASNQCSNVSCHGGWKAIAWTATDSCTNCHNYPPDNTIAGTTNHGQTSPANIGIARLKTAHGGCDTCHGVSSSNDVTPTAFGTPVDKTSVSGDAYVITTHHMNGSVEMNGISAPDNGQNAAYNETSTGCGVACHLSTWVFNGTVRANTVDLRELGKGGCNGCHGGDNASAANTNYWPGGSGTTYPDRPGEHNAHITKLIAKLGYNIATLTDQQQKTMCAYCHTYTTNPGEAGHDTVLAPADVGGFNPMWSVLTASYPSTADGGTAATYTPGDGTNGTCAGIDCHNNKSTTTAYDWYDNAATACDMCHTEGGATNDPISGLHGVTPTVSGQRHGAGVSGGCATCHNALTAQATHIDGTFQGGNGQKVQMGFSGATSTMYTQTADNTGTCISTAAVSASCHTTSPTAKEDDWAHEWKPTSTDYTSATLSCQGCHGDQTNWNVGVIHRTSAATFNTHGGTGTYRCKDCHVLEATAATYIFSFGTNDWGGTSKHGNGTIEINSNGTTYNQTTNLCTSCHSTADGTHNFVDTTQTIASLAGDAIVVACGSCHTGGVQTGSASGSHTAHNAGSAALVAPGTVCVDCHGNNGGLNYQSTLAGTHGNSAVNFSAVTYSQAATRGNVTGTCTTTNCHNRGTGATQSEAWNIVAGSGTPGTNDLSCNACHYWEATPTAANDTTFRTNGRGGLSLSHDDHFTKSKNCNHCHAAVTTTAHINATTSNTDKAVAVLGEGGVAFTSNLATDPDYTYNTTEHSCYTPTNSGLGCHASAGATGSGDVSRPDWDTAIAATNCNQYCHSDTTTTAVNPTSGLHGVVPTISGIQHNQTVNGGTGCSTCHVVGALSTHINGTFTGDGSVAGDRTNMGLGTWYTNVSNNIGTCISTATVSANCHTTAPTAKEDDWAHEWNTPTNYTSSTLSCQGCHGIDGSWNVGIIHRTQANVTSIHGGTGTYKCKDCHGIGAAANTYTFSFGTNDWGGTSKHGNGSIEINSNGTTYNQTSGLCDACHLGKSDGLHNFVDTTQTIASIAADVVNVSCNSCHDTGSSGAPIVSAAASSHVDADGSATAYTAGTCTDCHLGHADGTVGVNDIEFSTQRTTPAVGTVPSMNNAYAAHGNKIRLGGNATLGSANTKSTEAEWCWACHGAQATVVTEWGLNQNAQTGNLNYNYGNLATALGGTTSTLDWTLGYWRSGSYAKNTSLGYKDGRITSTHSVNFNSGTATIVTTRNSEGYVYGQTGLPDNGTTTRKETVDAVANIRCSYCHDVHGTHNSAEPVAIQNNNPPYLRGTWKGNPYPEDMAPRSGWNTWTDNANYGRVPRGSAASNNSGFTTGGTNLGAYWIDQNSGNPNSGLNTLTGANNTSGLCALCHGGVGDVGATNGQWTAARLDALDYVDDSAGVQANRLWVGAAGGGVNGHQNVVLGSSGTTNNNNNIFTRTRRGSSSLATGPNSTTGRYAVDMGLGTYSAGQTVGGYSYRGLDANPMWTPSVTTRSAYNWQKFAWNAAYNAGTPTTGSDKAAGTIDLNIGNLSAGSGGGVTEPAAYAAQSKYHTFNCGKCHNPHASRLPKLLITNCLDTNHNTWDDTQGSKASTATTPWANSRDSQWPSAQNCHRLDSNGAKSTGNTSSRGDGWNKITPWVETNTPDP